MSDWLGLRGSRVLLVGAGGFGEALVEAFASVGSRLFVLDRDSERLAKVQAAQPPGAVRTHLVDISTEAACTEAVSAAAAALDGLDILVHAAGINRRTPLDEISPQEWAEIQAVNTTSCLWLGRAAAEVMRQSQRGSLVFISSVSAQLAHPHHAAYAASKGALNQLMRVMAIEWAADGINVNAVAPGYALTPLTAEYVAVPGRLAALTAKVPAGRLAAPSDVVGPVLMFSSPRLAYTTGQVVYVDGGRTLD